MSKCAYAVNKTKIRPFRFNVTDLACMFQGLDAHEKNFSRYGGYAIFLAPRETSPSHVMTQGHDIFHCGHMQIFPHFHPHSVEQFRSPDSPACAKHMNKAMKISQMCTYTRTHTFCLSFDDFVQIVPTHLFKSVIR
jgi:hypothetical protein